MSEVKIIGNAPFGTEIYVDGKKVEGVSNYTLSQNAGEMPTLNLVIPVGGLDINTPFVIKGEEVESLANEPTSK